MNMRRIISSKQNLIILLLSILLAVSLVFSFTIISKNNKVDKQIASLESLLDDYKASRSIDQKKIGDLSDENNKLRERIKSISNNDFTIDRYLERYNKNKEELLSDLENYSELISFEGVLGGKMQYFASESSVISSRWALGYFEDGHICGYSLLEYKIQEKGEVQWKIIDSYLLDE